MANICINKRRRKQFACENTKCGKTFEKIVSQISAHNYCSRSCSVSVNNSKFPKNPALRKNCAVCNKIFISRKKYCSVECQHKGQIISSETILDLIKSFYLKQERVPLKREFSHARAARERFGSWNKAILAAGFTPNPVMFSQKHIAKDGHKCDSLAEKIIDDWLYKKKIGHERSISYPGNPKLTADFVVNDYWIEFFGLFGEHKRYDELRKEKLKLAEEYNLKFIEIYPDHLFPKNTLTKTFLPLTKS